MAAHVSFIQKISRCLNHSHATNKTNKTRQPPVVVPHTRLNSIGSYCSPLSRLTPKNPDTAVIMLMAAEKAVRIRFIPNSWLRS